MFGRIRILPISTALLLTGAAALALMGVACQREAPAARPGPGANAQEPRAVRVVSAEAGRLPRAVTVTGTLAADEEVVAGFKVAGRVSEIAVDLGSPVRRGQVLARLDPTDYRIRVAQADAALRQARAGLGLPPEGTDERVDPEKTALVRGGRPQRIERAHPQVHVFLQLIVQREPRDDDRHRRVCSRQQRHARVAEGFDQLL